MGSLNLSLFLCFSCISLCYTSLGQQTSYNSFLISSFSYPQTKLKPFDWRYMRVELPPRFSSMTMTFRSNVDVGNQSIEKLSKSTFPLICFREGGPPLPDVSDTYLSDLVVTHMLNGSMRGVVQCLFFQQNITFTLTNEQISSGAWYFGFFNGLGPARTQSKMITRGSSYTFSTDVSVEGCVIPTMWGPYCNYSIDPLSCTQSVANTYSRSLIGRKMYEDGRNPNHPVVNYSLLDGEEKESASNSSMVAPEENVVICKNSLDAACLGDGESKVYSLDIVDPALQLKIMATSVRSNQTLPKNDTDGVLIMCYARYNAMPLRVVYDYSGDISRGPLLLNLPQIGQWYISIYVINQTKIQGEIREEFIAGKFCFSLEWQMHDCPNGKAGLNCTWDSHLLQRVLRKGSSLPYESYYLPIQEKMLIKSANFPVGPILSNSTFNDKLDGVWTYFLLEVPRGAAGASLHFQIASDAKVSYEIYARFGGLPSLDTWDYYVNRTHSSNGSMFLDFSDSSEGKINFYVIYAKEGIWNFGLRDPIGSSSSKDQIVMSITLEGCPRRCSSHGICHSAADESGLTLYSFCACDRNHGGFDCGIELVTHQDNRVMLLKFHVGHMWQSIALIASNGAAILPAFWCLRQKAFSEWVLFTSSGISSGLYHACDVGTWCALSFHVLQFMDFWLSFMAVVSTFVYMTTIDEVSKRAIQTTVSIFTALMAATGATRSANIILVVVIGILGLLIGWLFEFSSTIRSIYSSYRYICQPDIWQILKGWLFNLMRTLNSRFRWYFMFLGFVALSAAGISWKLETSKSYWIWHSIWHITIYTSSFFFLCSTSVNNNDGEHQQSQYELTRQNSSSRADSAATGQNSSSRADLATNGNSS